MIQAASNTEIFGIQPTRLQELDGRLRQITPHPEYYPVKVGTLD